MSDVRLGNLVIENFRSLNGSVSIPLDAPIVLLHGSNGMGKTSVLSALELALTGQIEHLERIDPQYPSHLLHRGAAKGSVQVTQAGKSRSPSFGGSIQIDEKGKSGKNLLSLNDAKFFSERCYLPQSALGRLLELYQDSDTNEKTSPLTKFVKDLLGLDQLDAIVDGLHSSFNVARIRNLVPEYRRWENIKATVEQDIEKLVTRENELRKTISGDKATIGKLLRSTYGDDNDLLDLIDSPAELAKELGQRSREDKEIVGLTRTRQELTSLNERWASLPKNLTQNVRQDREQAAKRAQTAYEKWLGTKGARLDALVKPLRDLFPNLPPTRGSNPVALFDATETSAIAERDRCLALLQASKEASDQVQALNKTIARSKARIENLDTELNGLAGDAEDLARVLAGIAPHIHGEVCPICSRDFSETGKKSLSTHVAASIAALTKQAGKLKAYTQEKAQEAAKIRQAEQALVPTKKGELSGKQIIALTERRALLDESIQALAAIRKSVSEGADFLRVLATAREALAQASKGTDQGVEIRRDLEKWIASLQGKAIEEFDSVGAAIAALIAEVTAQIAALQTRQERQRELRSLVSTHLELVSEKAGVTKERTEAQARSAALQAAARKLNAIRVEAKQVSSSASNARAAIVGRVFNTSLNKMWRDLFVRLAPSEQFVPAFKLPENAQESIEASLETVHRGDQAVGGSPGTMLSAGNLNTAALTLFLALHLSVSKRLPWLILDDPVQSMDDVHISQFAALLRSVSKGLDRQVVLAVHDRALFDYLALEMSPAFQGDRLITVELSRTTDGKSVATPQILTFRPEKAIAA